MNPKHPVMRNEARHRRDGAHRREPIEANGALTRPVRIRRDERTRLRQSVVDGRVCSAGRCVWREVET